MKTLTAKEKITLWNEFEKKKSFITGLVPSADFVNYDMRPNQLTDLGFNRGANKDVDEAQYKRARVNAIKEKIKTGIWFWCFAVMYAFENAGKYFLLDGHNRLQAVNELIAEGFLPKDFTFPVQIVKDERIQAMSKKELAEVVSIVNDYDARWRESEHVKTGLIFKLPTAQALIDLKKQFDNAEIVADGKKVRSAYNWIYALAIGKAEFALTHSKVSFSKLMDNSIGKKMQSEEFNEEFVGFINVLKNHAVKWSDVNGVRMSASVGHIIHWGQYYGFKKLNTLLRNAGNPKTEKDLKNFFAKIY